MRIQDAKRHYGQFWQYDADKKRLAEILEEAKELRKKIARFEKKNENFFNKRG